ncbi:MAG: hypothetical protein P4N60_13960 [Verrucomicrobiae bacterium]|nr:hypothetical protein [Verrucomicrobiae bacterium]
MKITAKKIIAAVVSGFGLVAAITLFTNPDHAHSRLASAAETASPAGSILKTADRAQAPAGVLPPVKSETSPPFILADTSSSSPDTNLVGNLVIFTAKIGGTPPITLQWKVNKGGGFVAVPDATNSWLGITNAQISDSGLYALFATNFAGGAGTTPRAITLVDGVD